MYSEFCQCTIAEVDKYINYKSQGKMLRKKFKSYKPFWNSELTNLWKDMCHKERSARCLTSNLQHKKSLRMKFSTARKTFDKRLRYYERQYNKNIIANIETVSSSNPREFWQKIKTHCQCNKKLSIYLYINKMKNIMEPPFKCILLSLAYFLYYFLKKSLVIFTVAKFYGKKFKNVVTTSVATQIISALVMKFYLVLYCLVLYVLYC